SSPANVFMSAPSSGGSGPLQSILDRDTILTLITASQGATMFRLSVCAETFFRKLPLAQRAKEIARAGFLVEFWAWHERGLEAIAADPDVHISAFPGYMGGSMMHPDGLAAFLNGVKRSLAF